MNYCRLLLASILVLLSALAASAQQISYDRVVFLREAHGDTNDPWAQLQFRVEGFRIDGDCYKGCSIGFTLDSSLRYPRMSNVGIRRHASWLGGGLVNGDLPFDQFGQVFLGSTRKDIEYSRQIYELPTEEKLAVAWVFSRSTELIELALREDFGAPRFQELWRLIQPDFERRATNGSSVVQPEIGQINRRANTRTELTVVIQPALATRRLYAGRIGGLAGRSTDAAIKSFQRNIARLATGYIDSVELNMLREGLSSPPGFQNASVSRLLETRRCVGCDLRNVDLSYKLLLGSDLSDANLDGADLTGARLMDADLSGASLINANLKGALFSGANLVSADLTGAEVSGWVIERANLCDAVGPDGNLMTIGCNGSAEQISSVSTPEVSPQSATEANRTQLTESASEASDLSVVDVSESEPVAEVAQPTEASSEIRLQLAETRLALSETRRQLDAVNGVVVDQDQRIAELESLSLEAQEASAEAAVSKARVAELERQLSAANGTVADLRDGIESNAAVQGIQRELDAANATNAELRARIESNYVPRPQFEELERQLSASSSSIADLRERMEQDFVPRADYNSAVVTLRGEANEVLRQLDASSKTIADLRDVIRVDYVPRTELAEATRQIRALNGTMVEIQEITDRLRNRMIESDSLLSNFRDDCRALPSCARAMQLD